MNTQRPSPVIASVRAFSPAKRKGKKGRNASCDPRWPDSVLVFDTETSTDETQRLLFGAYRYLRWDGQELTCASEGLFYGDDLPERDPGAFEALKGYAETHRADVAPGKDSTLYLMSRREWVEEVLWQASYKARCLVVAFNLPFDLSRLAVSVGEARGRYRGGFSFSLWDYEDADTGERRENKFRPRVLVKHIDSRMAFVEYSRPAVVDEVDQIPPGSRKPDKRYSFPGYFLDLRTLTFALTSEAHSLNSACEAFGVKDQKSKAGTHGEVTEAYIGYCRQDVRVTSLLLERVREQFDAHPIDLRPWKAYSPASVAKAYLRAMGVDVPTLKTKGIPLKVLGACMSSYFGGRAECRIRRVEVPVVYCDFLSMYPTVNTLLGLWPLITAREVEMVDATEEARQLLEEVTLEKAFDSSTWTQLRFFAEIVPDGDILPLRTEYSEATKAKNIGVNRVSSEVPLWYSGPDLVASKLLSGKVPKVRRAFKLMGRGTQKGLRPIKLAGSVPVDPASGDFFRTVIERRREAKQQSGPEAERVSRFLKILANSGSYGIFAEINRQTAGEKKKKVQVVAPMATFPEEVDRPEEPGPYFFPPLAALTTAAARLMLAMLERAVTDLGGSYAFCDTDSMAIVATEAGGLLPCPGGFHQTPDGREAVLALSWAQVQEITRRFESLNPYGFSGSVLEIEGENFHEGRQRELWALATSAKRYALFLHLEDGEVGFGKAPSEHGLGHLLDPIQDDRERWYLETWRQLRAVELEGEEFDAEWLRIPAVSQTSVSSPHLLRPFADYNHERAYADQIKPFNFLLSAQVSPFGHPVGADPKRFHLVAPYMRDPPAWARSQWMDVYSRCRFSVRTGLGSDAEKACLRSYREVLEGYRVHPEPKSAGPYGRPCGRETVGLLRRRYLQVVAVELIGKESNRMEDVQNGLVHDWDEVVESYGLLGTSWWDREILPRLKGLKASELAEVAGVSVRHIKAIRNGGSEGSPSLRRKLVLAVFRLTPA
mgnify:CR=1 FL=1